MKRVCSLVAQMGDLWCRRLAIVVVLERFRAWVLSHAAQNSILRYSRLPVCATSGSGVEKTFRSEFGVRSSLFDVFLSSFNSWKTLPMNPGTSSPHPSPPFRMEERVPEGRERRRWLVHGFNARKDLFRRILTPALSHPMGEGDIDRALGLFPKHTLSSIATIGFSDLRKSDADTNGIHGNNSSNPQSPSDDSEPPSLPWFRTWRGVYVFVGACFVLYVVLLTALSRAFS